MRGIMDQVKGADRDSVALALNAELSEMVKLGKYKPGEEGAQVDLRALMDKVAARLERQQ
jgi:hypothetical protein